MRVVFVVVSVYSLDAQVVAHAAALVRVLVAQEVHLLSARLDVELRGVALVARHEVHDDALVAQRIFEHLLRFAAQVARAQRQPPRTLLFFHHALLFILPRLLVLLSCQCLAAPALPLGLSQLSLRVLVSHSWVVAVQRFFLPPEPRFLLRVWRRPRLHAYDLASVARLARGQQQVHILLSFVVVGRGFLLRSLQFELQVSQPSLRPALARIELLMCFSFFYLLYDLTTLPYFYV